MNLSNFIRDVPDFPQPGIVFKDITPLLSQPKAYGYAIDLLTDFFEPDSVDVIASVESRGFLFASPVALKLNKPFVPLRKPGKLPFKTFSQKYELEYGKAELQLHIDSITAGARVVVIDDLLATGGTVGAASQLITKAGGKVIACAFLVELTFLNGRESLKPLTVNSIIKY